MLVHMQAFGAVGAVGTDDSGWKTALFNAFADFKAWLKTSKIEPSQKPFKIKMLVRDGYGFFLNAKGYNARVIAEWLLGKLISLNVRPIPNGIILDDRIRLCEVAMTFGWSSLYLWNIFWNKNATLILNPADSFPFKERHLSLLWTQWTSLKVSVARQQTPWAVRRWVAGILNLPWWEFCLISIIHLIAEKSVSCLRSESEASSLETAGRSFLLAYRQLNDISMRTGVFSVSTSLTWNLTSRILPLGPNAWAGCSSQNGMTLG